MKFGSIQPVYECKECDRPIYSGDEVTLFEDLVFCSDVCLFEHLAYHHEFDQGVIDDEGNLRNFDHRHSS